MLFPGNLDLLSQMLAGPVVPLVCGFIRRDNLQAWHELFTNLYKRKGSTLTEFIGYADSADCREFRQNIPEIMTNKSVSGNFDV